ncbi:Non-canonical non-ribosomal peptide synthetase-like protein 3 [Elsinoe fawcettii]|nr:Non-canonical non-ribosomal peptide synthetase-like protein 3 [Elsinoe fawcettii]
MASNDSVSYGNHLLSNLIDKRAEQKHGRPYASITLSANINDEFVDISYTKFATAINRCAKLLISELGPSLNYDPIIYMGPADLRYHVLAFAAPKAGYSVAFPSPKNALDTHLALVAESKAEVIASPSKATPLVSKAVSDKKLKQITIPELDVLLEESQIDQIASEHSFDETRNAPWIHLQSLDTKGRSNLVTLRQSFAASFESWSSLQTNPAAKAFAEKKVFCSVPFYHALGLIQSILTLTTDSTVVLPPPGTLSPAQVDKIHTTNSISASILSPSLIAELAGNPDQKHNLLKLQSLIYTGAVLPKEVGDALANTLSLSPSIASPEIGLLPTLPSSPSSWDYIRFNLAAGGFEFRKTDVDDDSFELVLVKDNKTNQHLAVFSTFSDLTEYPTKHLFSQHPTDSDLWKYKGRTDNVITLEDGDDFNPEIMEDVVTSSPHVKSCMVVGHGRPFPCLLIEPHDHAEEGKSQRGLDNIWPAIDQANQRYPRSAQVQRGLVLLTYPDVPLPRDTNGHIKRFEAYQLYRPDINTLYNEHGETLSKGADDSDLDTFHSSRGSEHDASYKDPKTMYSMQHLVGNNEKELPPPPPRTAMDHVKKFLNKKDNFADEPPNGGIVAWLQVLGCFLVFMNNWGLASSFGVYQAYYQLPTSSPSLSAQGKTASQISWIGTIQAAFTLIFGVLSGPLFDKGYFFQTLVVASIMMCFSFMMLSLCDQYWQIVIVQGVLQGICSGFLYIPSVAQIPQYFTTKRGLALGIVTAGAPFGGIIYPIIFRELITNYDFAWATRAIGFVALALLVISWIILKPLNLKNKIEKELRDPTMFKDPPYVSFLAGSFLLFCGMLIPYVLCATYSVTVVDGYDRADFARLAAASARNALSEADRIRFLNVQDTAFYTVAIINAGNFFGRIIPCGISDLGIGPEYMLFGCDLALSILGFVWITVKQRANYNAFLVLYGFFSGGIASLPAAALPYICPRLEVFATRLGLVYFFAGIGVLIGTPISTAIDARTSDPDDYLGSQLWVGITMALGLVCILHSGYHGGKRRRVIQAKAKEERRRKQAEKNGGELKA